MANILVLGAGVYQIPVIECIHRMGHRAIVASIPGNYPGFALADEVVYEDTRNKEALLEVARDRNVRAVLTAGTDVAIPSMGYICEHLGLPGIDARTGVLSTTKINMKQAFMDAGVSTAEFYTVPVDASLDECREVAQRIGYPVICKAVDSSGSRGCVCVEEPGHMAAALAEVREVTSNDHFIIEKYLVGIEFGMQLFMQHGELKLAMTHGDYVSPGATSVPMGHYVPYGDKALAKAATEESVKAARAVGIGEGAVNVDAILCDDKVYIIEIGARAGATLLPELVCVRYGFDYYQAIVDCALGNEVTVPAETDACSAAMVLCPNRAGTIVSVDHMPKVAGDVQVASLDVGAGDTVRQFHVGPDRIGQILAVGDTLDAAEATLHAAQDSIRITMDDGAPLDWLEPKRV
ncbi:MAG: ATP-grasp domain-containing protein [Coriobacteriales bacterium]|nr:ATP-grasp domain-containing protein [Coriobacteriales bacterium]